MSAMSSKQPRKQRKQAANAPLHERHRQLRAPLADELQEEYAASRARVNAGDTVEVLRGDHAGHEGEVVTVDTANVAVHVEGVTVEKADGEEVARPVHASNLRITELDLDDDRRRERLEGDEE